MDATRLSRRAGNPKLVAENLIKKYGRDNFQRLIQLFIDGESGEKIAFAYDVTRQRVHSWRKVLGVTQTTFVPHTSIEHLVGSKNRSLLSRTVI